MSKNQCAHTIMMMDGTTTNSGGGGGGGGNDTAGGMAQVFASIRDSTTPRSGTGSISPPPTPAGEDGAAAAAGNGVDIAQCTSHGSCYPTLGVNPQEAGGMAQRWRTTWAALC